MSKFFCSGFAGRVFIAVACLFSSQAHADWVLNLGPNFDVRVIGTDSFTDRSTTYEMLIQNLTNTTFDCTGSIGYYRVDTGSTVMGNSGQGAAPPGGPWRIVASTVGFSEKLATGYDYLKASCTPRTEQGTGGGGGLIGGGTGGTQYARFGAGMLGYTLSPEKVNAQGLRTPEAELRVARIENRSGSRTTGTVTLELWALNAPYTGAATTGYLMTATRLPTQCTDSSGRMSPGVACTDVVLRSQLAYPPQGTYTAVYVLKETPLSCPTPSCSEPVDYFNFTTKGLAISATNNSPQGLSFTGSATYSLNVGNNAASFTAERLINNSSTNTTNLLQLELWLTSQPYTGANFTGYKILATSLPGSCNSTLSPGASCVNMSYSNQLATKVPDGTYYVTLMATQQTPLCSVNGGYCVSTSVAMGTVSVTNPVVTTPTPPPPTTPPASSADSGGGGGGAFSFAWLLGLVATAFVRRGLAASSGAGPWEKKGTEEKGTD